MKEEMWMPEPSKRLTEFGSALIERDYNDLMYYDGPILFTGRNAEGGRVIGSSVERDRATEAYLHAEIDGQTFEDFIGRRISYPETLRRARALYLIHWTGVNVASAVWGITFEDIPESYRPRENAFCPEDVELIEDEASASAPLNAEAPRTGQPT